MLNVGANTRTIREHYLLSIRPVCPEVDGFGEVVKNHLGDTVDDHPHLHGACTPDDSEVRPFAGGQRGGILIGGGGVVLAVGRDIKHVVLQSDFKGGLAVKVTLCEDARDGAGARVDPGLEGPVGKPRIALLFGQRNGKASGLQFASVQRGGLEAAGRGRAHGVQRTGLGIDFSLVLKAIVVGVLLARIRAPILLLDVDESILVIVLLTILDAVSVGVRLGRVGVGEVFVVVVKAVLVEVGIVAVGVIACSGEVAEVFLLPPVGDLVAVAVRDEELVDVVVRGDDYHAEAVVGGLFGLVGIVGVAPHLGLQEAVCRQGGTCCGQIVDGGVVGSLGIRLLGLLRLRGIRGGGNCRVRGVEALPGGGDVILCGLDSSFQLRALGGDAGVRRLAAVVEGEVEDHVRGALDFQRAVVCDFLRRALGVPDAELIDEHGEAARLFGQGANHEVAHGGRAIEAAIAEGGVFRQLKPADHRMELDAVGVVVGSGRGLLDGDGDVNPAVGGSEGVIRVADRLQGVRVRVGGDANLHVGHLEGAVLQEEPEVGEFGAKRGVGLLDDRAACASLEVHPQFNRVASKGGKLLEVLNIGVGGFARQEGHLGLDALRGQARIVMLFGNQVEDAVEEGLQAVGRVALGVVDFIIVADAVVIGVNQRGIRAELVDFLAVREAVAIGVAVLVQRASKGFGCGRVKAQQVLVVVGDAVAVPVVIQEAAIVQVVAVFDDIAVIVRRGIRAVIPVTFDKVLIGFGVADDEDIVLRAAGADHGVVIGLVGLAAHCDGGPVGEAGGGKRGAVRPDKAAFGLDVIQTDERTLLRLEKRGGDEVVLRLGGDDGKRAACGNAAGGQAIVIPVLAHIGQRHAPHGRRGGHAGAAQRAEGRARQNGGHGKPAAQMTDEGIGHLEVNPECVILCEL